MTAISGFAYVSSAARMQIIQAWQLRRVNS